MTQWQAVTFNLGCAGPGGSKYIAPATTWAEEVRAAKFDIVFAQEIPDDAWLAGWRHAGYSAVIGTGPTYRTRSAVLVRKPIICSRPKLRTAGYHGSYVATAALPELGDLYLLSVHASPSRVSSTWNEQWRKTGMPFPQPRSGEPLWDSDLLLSTVKRVATGHPVIVAGDWNEARAWDAHHPGETSGEEFFRRVEDGTLIDSTWRAWNRKERPTFHASSARGLQDDHVFASPDVDRRLSGFEVLQPGRPRAGRSDHLPISFTIDL